MPKLLRLCYLGPQTSLSGHLDLEGKTTDRSAAMLRNVSSSPVYHLRYRPEKPHEKLTSQTAKTSQTREP